MDGWLFVTGQLATDPDDDSRPIPAGIEAQTHKVFDNLKRALSGAKAGLEHVLCVRIFLTHFDRDYATLNRIYLEYFPKERLPARTTVGVTDLARGGIVEIDYDRVPAAGLTEQGDHGGDQSGLESIARRPLRRRPRARPCNRR